MVRPPAGKLGFLPERPYLPHGSARDILIPRGQEDQFPNQDIARLFEEIGLVSSKLKTPEDFEVARNWEDGLSLSKQQLMSVAHVILAEPEFVFLDNLGSALNDNAQKRVLEIMAGRGITCISFGEEVPDPALHDAGLELKNDGSWEWTALR